MCLDLPLTGAPVSQAKICPQCGEEYSLEQRFCPSDGSTLRLQDESADLVGSIVADRYHVLGNLGEGGMGRVYLAEHVKMGRRSALKIMNAELVSNADAVARFNREAANASRISHPNVASVYDFGETPDGVIYLAMELVDGPSLTQLIEQQGALPPLRAAEIVRQTADALSAAHDLGIVHRDLKPDNIMIARTRDGADLVKVVDFGIAKAADAPAQKVTKTGLVVGTPQYMSPEQLAGDRLDGRSDVYALGLVAFNMLTGELPFPAETVQESLIMRLTETPKRLAEVKADVAWTPAVQAALDHALARDAAKRPTVASEFGRELYGAVQRMPQSAVAAMRTEVMEGRGTRDEGRVRDEFAVPIPATRVASTRRRRTGVFALGAVGVLAAAGVVLLALHGGRTPASAQVPIATDSATAAQVTPTSAQATPAADSQRTGGGPNEQTAGAVPRTRDQHGAGAIVAKSAPVSIELARLERLTDPTQGADAASARRAIATLDSLRPRITNREDEVHAEVIRAEARMALQDDAGACRILRGVAADARGTTRRNRVTYLLGYACQ